MKLQKSYREVVGTFAHLPTDTVCYHSEFSKPETLVQLFTKLRSFS